MVGSSADRSRGPARLAGATTARDLGIENRQRNHETHPLGIPRPVTDAHLSRAEVIGRDVCVEAPASWSRAVFSTRRWYKEQTLANGWCRRFLALQIDAQAHARHGKAVSNVAARSFAVSLNPLSDHRLDSGLKETADASSPGFHQRLRRPAVDLQIAGPAGQQPEHSKPAAVGVRRSRFAVGSSSRIVVRPDGHRPRRLSPRSRFRGCACNWENGTD